MCLLPGAGFADGIAIPGLTQPPPYPRPSYRERYNKFPTSQHDRLGRRLPPPLIGARPTYRETYNRFPPPDNGGVGNFFNRLVPNTPAGPLPAILPAAYSPPPEPGSGIGTFLAGAAAFPSQFLGAQVEEAEALRAQTLAAAPLPVPVPVASSPAPVGVAMPGYAVGPEEAPPVATGFFAALAPAPSPLTAAPPAYAAPLGAAEVNPLRASLPQGGLPDYRPDDPREAVALSGAAPAAEPSLDPTGFFAGLGLVPQPGAGAREPTPQAIGVPEAPSDPAFARQVVAYDGRERPGTIIIDTPDKFLYLVQGQGQAIRYGIGVGRPGFTWAGVKSITRKAEWPGWTPPSQMLRRRPDLPRHMEGGIGNPLGARAMYLGSSLYRIHGTNEPGTIGTNVSSGCIRMMNADVIDLYNRVAVGTRVVVL